MSQVTDKLYHIIFCRVHIAVNCIIHVNLYKCAIFSMVHILEKTISSWIQIVSDPFVLTIKYIDLKHPSIEPLWYHLSSARFIIFKLVLVMTIDEISQTWCLAINQLINQAITKIITKHQLKNKSWKKYKTIKNAKNECRPCNSWNMNYFTLPEHLSLPPVFGGVRVARSLVFCVVFCR